MQEVEAVAVAAEAEEEQRLMVAAADVVATVLVPTLMVGAEEAGAEGGMTHTHLLGADEVGRHQEEAVTHSAAVAVASQSSRTRICHMFALISTAACPAAAETK